MADIGVYQRNHVQRNFTRVELLLELYDHALNALHGCSIASQNEDTASHATHYLDFQKSILALYSGLMPETDEVARNIARLLLYAHSETQVGRYEDAIKILTELRQGFAAVKEEAIALEREGVIPPMPDSDEYRVIA